MHPANPHRGEVSVPLKAGAVILRPTWDCISAIEGGCGLGLYNLARKLAGGHISLIDLSVIISAGATAAGRKMSGAEAMELVMATGIMPIYPAVLAFVTNAVTGGSEPEEGAAPGEGVAAEVTAPPSAVCSA